MARRVFHIPDAGVLATIAMELESSAGAHEVRHVVPRAPSILALESRKTLFIRGSGYGVTHYIRSRTCNAGHKSRANDGLGFAIRRKDGMFIAMNCFRVKRGAEWGLPLDGS